jgi:hypothetical protein
MRRCSRLGAAYAICQSPSSSSFALLLFCADQTVSIQAGYPIFVEITNKTRSIRGSGSFNLGGTNASGQVPDMPGVRGLIDPETPIDAYSITSREGPDWELVFSDEVRSPLFPSRVRRSSSFR